MLIAATSFLVFVRVEHRCGAILPSSPITSMSLSKEEIQVAEKMHTLWKVARRRYRQGIAAMLGIFPGIMIALFHDFVSRPDIGWSMLGIYFGLGVAFSVTWRLYKNQLERERIILEVLRRDHPDELPWVKDEEAEAEVNRHLAAVKEIEQELAKNRAPA